MKTVEFGELQIRPLLCGAGLLLASSVVSPAFAAEIKVELFGQPCLMTGPFDNKTLQIIHEISPEQFPPVETSARAREFVKKVEVRKQVPASLQAYRTQLERHLKSLAAFLEGMEALRKTKQPDEFMKAVRSSLNLPADASKPTAAASGVDARREAALKKRRSRSRKPLGRDELVDRLRELAGEFAAGPGDSVTVDKMKDIYLGLTEPNPEEEFHKTIRKMGVHYQCSFDEARSELDDGHEDDESEESAGEPSVTETEQ